MSPTSLEQREGGGEDVGGGVKELDHPRQRPHKEGLHLLWLQLLQLVEEVKAPVVLLVVLLDDLFQLPAGGDWGRGCTNNLLPPGEREKLPLNEDAIATSTLVSGSPTHLLLEVTFMAVEAPSPTSPDCTGQDSACSTEAARAHCPTHLPELVGMVPEKSWSPVIVFRVTDVNRDHQQDSPAMTWERILIATVCPPSGGGNSEGRDPCGLSRGRD